MVRHQRDPMDIDATFPGGLSQVLEKPDVGLAPPKDGRPIVSSVGDMNADAGDEDSRRSRHADHAEQQPISFSNSRFAQEIVRGPSARRKKFNVIRDAASKNFICHLYRSMRHSSGSEFGVGVGVRSWGSEFRSA